MRTEKVNEVCVVQSSLEVGNRKKQ